MSAYLYLRSDGKPVTVHSYSSGALFDECARKYQLAKIRGYKRKGNKGSLKFGICVEEGLMYFHANGKRSGDGVDEFKRRWLAFKDDTTMEFTDKEGSWGDLYRMGAAMLRLYELRLPSLPVVDPTFQLNYKREVFPGTELAGIEHTAFIDIVSKAPWVHPLLPRVEIPKGSAYRPVLIDCKTAGAPLGAAEDMLTLDPQLREYAWTSGIDTIGFLWFVKARHGSFDKGTAISFLDDAGIFKAGDQGTAIFVQKPDKPVEESAELLSVPKRKSSKPAAAPRTPITEESVGCVPPSLYYDYEQGAKDLRGKALEEFKLSFVTEFGSLVPPEAITKVRVQFAATRISGEDMHEAGQNVGRQVVSIVNASKTNSFPKQPSIRFPNTRCTFCEMRGLCLDRPEITERLLVQITPAEAAKPEPDWLDDLEGQD